MLTTRVEVPGTIVITKKVVEMVDVVTTAVGVGAVFVTVVETVEYTVFVLVVVEAHKTYWGLP